MAFASCAEPLRRVSPTPKVVPGAALPRPQLGQGRRIFVVSKQCTDFLFHSAVNITAQFSDMIPNLANIMQFADVGLHCCKMLSDGKALCNELMLHHTMQCTGASCRMLQIRSNFAANFTQPKRFQKQTAKILYAGTFTQRCFHEDMFFDRHLHIHMLLPRGGFTHKYLHTGVFTQACFYAKNFYTQTRGYLYAQVRLHSDAFTEERFDTHMLLHTTSFNTN